MLYIYIYIYMCVCVCVCVCQTSVVYVLCSRLLFPYMVSFLSSFHVIIS